MWTEKIRLHHIYDFDYCLKRFAMDPLIKLDFKNREVNVPIKINDEKHVVTVKATGTTASPEFLVSGASELKQKELISRVTDLFQWEVDLDQVTQHFLDTNLEQLFYAHAGTPIVRDFNLYYSLMKGIIHQQLNMKFAYTLSTRFVEKYGEKHEGVWFYPDPATVAKANYEELRELQFSQRKAEYVIDTSKRIAEGELDLTALSRKNRDEIMDRLVKIRGIGPWTAENWLLFGLGRQDELPVADIGIKNALKFYFQKEKKPSVEEIRQWSDEWNPYQSYASITLWRSIDKE